MWLLMQLMACYTAELGNVGARSPVGEEGGEASRQGLHLNTLHRRKEVHTVVVAAARLRRGDELLLLFLHRARVAVAEADRLRVIRV